MPKDVFHYTQVGTDLDGLSLYRSELGTNMNEILHQKYADLVGPFAVGTRIARVLTVLCSFRFNISVGISRGGEPNFGTDRHELVNQTQHWLIKNFAVFAWPGHKNLLDFLGSDFVSVGIGPLPVDPEIINKGPPMPGLSSDYTYLCKKMGLVLAPLPPSTIKEFKIFTHHMRHGATLRNQALLILKELRKTSKQRQTERTSSPKLLPCSQNIISNGSLINKSEPLLNLSNNNLHQ